MTKIGSDNIRQANVYSLWNDLDGGAFNFPRTMQNTAIPCTAPCFWRRRAVKRRCNAGCQHRLRKLQCRLLYHQNGSVAWRDSSEQPYLREGTGHRVGSAGHQSIHTARSL